MPCEGRREAFYYCSGFRCFEILVLVAALILGSHAMHDAFAVIRWSAAGISPGYCELTLVRIGGCRGAGVLPDWLGARNSADAGRRGPPSRHWLACYAGR